MPTPIPADLPRLPVRDRAGHKGTFGTVVVVGGSATSQGMMAGAPALAALGALRAGAGLAKLLVPEAVAPVALTVCPSATCRTLPAPTHGEIDPSEASALLDETTSDAQCLAIGPGLGVSRASLALTLRAVQQEEAPVIVDADALNALAATPDLHLDFRAAAVLTPHPGEYRRLAQALRITADPVAPGARPHAAETLARRLGCIVVLKGAGTVVTDGHSTWICPAGHPCLATAGTGDVLTGLIAGLAAQHVRPGPMGAALAKAGRAMSLYDATRVAVFAHALAAERWAERKGADAGLLAQELAEEIPGVLASLATPP